MISLTIRVLSLVAALFAALPSFAAIRVVVWDEQQPAQKEAYTNFLGNQIAAHLRTVPGLEVKSVSINDPEKGVSDMVLTNCDVLVWWGHQRQTEISSDKAKQIVGLIKEGKLSLIALHSAHWSEPFVEAMRERTRLDVHKSIPSGIPIEFVTPERFKVPKADAPLTPRTEWVTNSEGTKMARVIFPNCVFPAYRADGAASHLTVTAPDHPIAKEIPAVFD